MSNSVFDIVVIGGGINGAGIAADAAGRGLRVLLAEADDLAGATSSASSKLIHGGLRYLEQSEFRLVREALAEREVLLAKAPHIIWPLQFVLPQIDGMRPAWMLRAGLFLYDHLATRQTLGPSHGINLEREPAGVPLVPALKRGFSYWDCWVDDARLVVLNAMAAREAGAEILTRSPVTDLSDDGVFWTVTIESGGKTRKVLARALVNAAGPWVSDVARLSLGSRNVAPPRVKLVKGSHIVVPRINGADQGYIFQNHDGRVVFALPFEAAFTLIGTTDEAYGGDPRAVAVSAGEERYLLDLANRFFKAPLRPQDIVWRFAGVRPLDDDGSANPSAVSRDYRLELDAGSSPPVLHVIGGKITTYRRLAEAALDALRPHLPHMGPKWTAGAHLPGGDVGSGGFEPWFRHLAARYPHFETTELLRLARRYGTRITRVLEDAKTPDDLGADLGGGLRKREITYLKTEEFARSAHDVLWRRTKTGLHITPERRARAEAEIQACLDAE